MRSIFVFVIFTTAFNCATAWRNFMGEFDKPSRTLRAYKPSEELWFAQYLNHFNPADDRVWKQRYFLNNDYYKPNGPVFLYIGAEGPASDKWVHQGQMFDEAKRFGAKMFLLEHRFYGKSQPASDLSVENLAYLNTEQALLDLAYFIEGMNKAHKLPKDTKWIVFGCSYAGSLAAWMRAKYPHLVHGAVSSSGPLLAKVDFPEYMVVVEDSLKTHSQACVDALSSATREMVRMTKSSSGHKKIKKLFKLCDPIDSNTTTEKDIANLHELIADFFAEVVQYNKNNRKRNQINIDTVCDILVDQKRGASINRLAEIVNNVMLKESNEKCLDYKYCNMIEEISNVTLTKESRVGGRQWLYQTCTEYGFYQTSTARPNLFGERFPLEFFLQLCADIFGPQFKNSVHSGVERTNIIFGAFDLENLVSNVVFVHGNMDPWYPLGITKSSNPKAPAIFINGTAHCANVYPASKNDLPQLVEARKQTSQLIGQWLEN